jgi:hypothetical protein
MKKNKMKKDFSIIIPITPKGKVSVVKSIKNLDYQASRIQTIVVSGNNPPKNRNEGISKIKANFIGFVNAHSSVKENWVSQALLFFKKNPKIDIVGGPQLTSKEEKSFGKASGFALSSRFGSGAIYKRYQPSTENLRADETMITSANLICRKKVFDKVTFNENIYPGEDPKFIEDALNAGFKVAYSPNIQVYNFRRTTLGGLSKQIFNYGKTRPQKERFIKTLRKPFFIIPSLFVIYLLALLFLLQLSLLFIIPLYLYLLLIIIFSLIGAVKCKNMLYFFLLPIIFITIHLSYGLGFIFGNIWKNREIK